jgi:hypothetical protein
MAQNEQIKAEYKGCVVSITDPILGVRTIEVDRIKPEQIPQLKKYGFSFIFEVIKEPQPVEEEVKPKKPRKRRTNGKK